MNRASAKIVKTTALCTISERYGERTDKLVCSHSETPITHRSNSTTLTGKLLVACSLTASLVCTSKTAHADETDDLAGLLNESVVSGASRTAEAASDAPATSTSITGADLRAQGIRTLDEAIMFLGAGMTVERNQLGFSQYASRGVNIFQDWLAHVLLVVDGHVINNSNMGAAYPDKIFGIPMEAIDHIEVILGPGSVLYGTNAMHGTINVVTRRAKDIDGAKAFSEFSFSPNQNRAGGLVSPTLGRFGYQYRVGLSYGKELKLLNTPAEFTLHAMLLEDELSHFTIGPQYNYNNPDDARGPIGVGPKRPYGRSDVWGGYQENMHFFAPAVYSRLIWGNFEGSIRIAGSHHTQNETAPRFGQLNQQDGGGREDFAHIDLAYRFDVGDRLNIRARVYGDRYMYTDTNRYYTAWVCGTTEIPCKQASPTDNWRVAGEVTGNLDWFGDGVMNTMVGTDARILNVFGKTDTFRPDGSLADTSGYFKKSGDPAIAVYAQHIAAITRYLRLNGGVRYDWFSNADHWSPRGAVIANPWKGGTLKAIYSEGFRRPSPYESGFAAPGFQIAAKGLGAEVVRSEEAVYEQRFGAHLAKLSLFRSVYSGLIVLGSDAASGLAQYQNANSIKSYGGGLAYEAGFPRVRVGASTTVSSATMPSSRDEVSAAAWSLYGRNQPLLGAPSVSANAHGSYSFGESYPTVGLAGSLIGPRVSPAINDPFLGPLAASGQIGKSPTAVQIRATVTGDIGYVKGLSYRAAVNLAAPTKTFYLLGPMLGYRDANGNLHPEYQQLSRLTIITGLEYKF